MLHSEGCLFLFVVLMGEGVKPSQFQLSLMSGTIGATCSSDPYQ